MRKVLIGADIRVYINNKPYSEVQSVSFTVDYGEMEIYGIDAPYAQEIALTKNVVRGSVQGLRVKMSGGLQAKNIRPLFLDHSAASYISIRIVDRQTQEDIVFINSAKVTKESHTVPAKGSYKLSFDFVGQIAEFALDRA